MPQGVHTLRKIVSTVIALIFLAAAADVSIFHRADIAMLWQAGVATSPPRFFELAISLLSGLGLLGLLIISRQTVYIVVAFVRLLWATPEQLPYYRLEPKPNFTRERSPRESDSSHSDGGSGSRRDSGTDWDLFRVGKS
jgi:hypothetical protein